MKKYLFILLLLTGSAFAGPTATPTATPAPSIIGTPVIIPAYASAQYSANLSASLDAAATVSGGFFAVLAPVQTSSCIQAWYWYNAGDAAMIAGDMVSAQKFFARALFFLNDSISKSEVLPVADCSMANLTLFINAYKNNGKHL